MLSEFDRKALTEKWRFATNYTNHTNGHEVPSQYPSSEFGQFVAIFSQANRQPVFSFPYRYIKPRPAAKTA
jgi:hypothetical protein